MAEKREIKEAKEIKEKNGIGLSRIIMIVLLALILFLTAAILFFVISDNEVTNIMQTFQSQGENTILLEEFVVNLKDSGRIKHYLKVTMALMYTDEKQTEVIESSINKIRDTIIGNIRTKTYEDLLKDEGSKALKAEMISNINNVMGIEVVKDIYFTDIIVQ